MSPIASPLCERCWQPVLSHEEFIRLSHIVDVRPDGEPVYVWSYLHAYDAATGWCDVPAAAAA
jgi:hypothetical protein